MISETGKKFDTLANITTIVDNLEKRNYVRRKRDPQDPPDGESRARALQKNIQSSPQRSCKTNESLERARAAKHDFVYG
ncbi:MAG: MarR family transcriptional regulator [Nitrososphaerota archaeon]|nr:MarR family transcriptional regulator [Nitrososphaerota archaeon]